MDEFALLKNVFGLEDKPTEPEPCADCCRNLGPTGEVVVTVPPDVPVHWKGPGNPLRDVEEAAERVGTNVGYDAMQDENYTAWNRRLMRQIAESLHLPPELVAADHFEMTRLRDAIDHRCELRISYSADERAVQLEVYGPRLPGGTLPRPVRAFICERRFNVGLADQVIGELIERIVR